MVIYVCMKQVPDTETKIICKADRSGIETSAVKWIINPYDEFAIEEALKLKEQHSQSATQSSVTVFSLGPKQRVVESLRSALAMGCDDAVVIDSPEYVDTFYTSKALALAIKTHGSFDIILTGKAAIDDNASAVSQQVAEFLNIPHCTVVAKLSVNDGSLVAEREIEGGTREIVELKLPALIGATKGLNTPRYPNLPGIMKAKKKVIKELIFNDLFKPDEVAQPYLLRPKDFELPKEKEAVKMIHGTPEAQAKELVRLLKDDAKIL